MIIKNVEMKRQQLYRRLRRMKDSLLEQKLLMPDGSGVMEVEDLFHFMWKILEGRLEIID